MSLFAKWGAWLLERLLLFWLHKLGDYLSEKARERAQKEIDQANLKAYREAVEEKKPDEELARLAENLLNSRKP